MISAASLKGYLQQCGYESELLRDNFRFVSTTGEQQVELAAFASYPIDARSACIAVISSQQDPTIAVDNCRDLGAPVIFVRRDDRLEWWKQGAKPQFLSVVPVDAIPAFFEQNCLQLNPKSVYRAKTRGRLEGAHQLAFVDIGLMPLVESEIGKRLSDLIAIIVTDLQKEMSSRRITDEVRHWFLTSAFWLIAAKILHDKQVPSFKKLDLRDITTVFERVARHYDAPIPLYIHDQEYRLALEHAAETAARFSNLGQVTTEALAYVYENSLVSDTTREDLGTHSTPSFLVDYVVGRLAHWIEEIPLDQRDVFEPACGHAAFLVSAMRLLRDLLPPGTPSPKAHQYFRDHLHGIEIDEAAREIARLSLTLADIPNPNGWDLKPLNMFENDTLERLAARATILLANPPFEKFSAADRDHLDRLGVQRKHYSKTAEVLARTLPHLRPGSVFGVVIPQNLLHETDAAELRSLIVREFEFAEIILFPDKVFSFSDCESAVLIGRRRQTGAQSGSLHFRRIREPEMEQFKLTYQSTTQREILQVDFERPPTYDLRSPELGQIWIRPTRQTLGDVTEIGQGLVYKGADKLPRGALTFSDDKFPDAVRGYANMGSDLQIHRQPSEIWMNLDPAVVRRPGTGATTGLAQILLNTHPVSRDPWRLKAIMDQEGHAVRGSFLTIRPKSPETTPLEVLWAICNSPYANAYAYTHGSKWDVTVGMMSAMPIPNLQSSDVRFLQQCVSDYTRAASAMKKNDLRAPTTLRELLLRVDAAVLRLYRLPPRLERELLNLFGDYPRRGVPFPWQSYFPSGFTPLIPLHIYLSEEFQQSTAGRLRELKGEVPESVREALSSAIDAFED